VLRSWRRLQLGRELRLRHARGSSVPEPGGVRELGRGALHGGRQSLRGQGVALRAVRPAADTECYVALVLSWNGYAVLASMHVFPLI
jgi:hypothetical protein